MRNGWPRTCGFDDREVTHLPAERLPSRGTEPGGSSRAEPVYRVHPAGFVVQLLRSSGRQRRGAVAYACRRRRTASRCGPHYPASEPPLRLAWAKRYFQPA